MKQTYQVQVTNAAPQTSVEVPVTDGVYSQVVGVRVISDNDNVSAAVSLQIVISRNEDPLSTGTILDEDALKRKDAAILGLNMAAGAVMIRGNPDPNEVILDEEELFGSDYNPHLGVRAVGLESGKVANVEVEIELQQVQASSAARERYNAQLVRFLGNN